MELDEMPVSIRNMTRFTDPDTSHEAAKKVSSRVTKLQEMVLYAFEQYGPMIDEVLVGLPQFSQYADSTVRSRRSELVTKGKLVQVGTLLNSRGQKSTLWSLK